MSIEQPFRFLGLPAEIRAQVLSYLLPNIPVIDCDTVWSPTGQREIGGENPYTYEISPGRSLYNFTSFRTGDYPYSPQILRVNRQLHSEAIAYLYHQRTFVLTIYQFGFDFLNKSGPLDVLPSLPYREIKHFVIRIKACNVPTAGRQFRKNLLRLCGLIHEQKIHFKKLTVDFMNHTKIYRYGQDDSWETESERGEHIPSLWEASNDGLENIPPEISDARWDHQNFEYAAWYLGWGSTLAYLMSPLMMLSGIVDEATIQLPNSCTGNPRYDMLKRYYEERLEGRYRFDEDDPDLIGLRWAFKHPHGPKEYCEDMCQECHALTMDMKRAREEDADREKREWDEHVKMWKAFADSAEDYMTYWQRGDRWYYKGLERCFGVELGNRIYHWLSPRRWRWLVWHKMILSRFRQPEPEVLW
ncbi:MAG: hypothetical protein LQ337_006311 [Flavoplaca oasis]|nr:MAG: hypothetical protein LQ337_006311 [Flavoplaca oasis]